MDFDYPRPLLQRPDWQSLNGSWQFAFDPEQQHTHPSQVDFDREILVPYCPESQKSGLHATDHCKAVWYRQTFTVPEKAATERTILHFAAVDHQARIWVNGIFATEHKGGHTPFSVDITLHLQNNSETFEIAVQAIDHPTRLDQPRGKQEWLTELHAIWYPRTTGIWQTVWLETVPQTHIRDLLFTPDLKSWSILLDAELDGPTDNTSLRIDFYANGRQIASDTCLLLGNHLQRRITLPDGSWDDVRNHLTWSPEHPQLIDVELTVLQAGQPTDTVQSYTALREVRLEEGRFLLNDRACNLRLVLDQGYWPESLMTATETELRRDILLTKRLGFNGVRKHQKIESARYLYWADRLGLMVWEEMPSAYALSDHSIQMLTQEWMEALKRDRGHPCIVAWVPINESWGVPDLTLSEKPRQLVSALYHLTRSLDSTRPVIGNDGWEITVSDILAVHDYTSDPEVIRERYGNAQRVLDTLKHERPGGRVLLLDKTLLDHNLPVMLTEFGGIAFAPKTTDGWGYSRADSSENFTRHYTSLLRAVHDCKPLSGFCYTQLTDTFQEKNGLLFEDRTFKGDPLQIAQATRGIRNAHQAEMDRNPDDLGYNHLWRAKQKSV
ncbi:glycoside hydrolase family 2 protein [Deinococcus roseus]|uniref:Beta-galactosidase n=1 Tax=Deinococcus roseus TaxID=392414 RepID=A0ABQ2D700_9DEIO|nr:sugar-binding domain-containing protein [Deinococcus roseus]GGJ47265.1 beta-galactosidase [Deinococcus roseus]